MNGRLASWSSYQPPHQHDSIVIALQCVWLFVWFSINQHSCFRSLPLPVPLGSNG